MSEVTFAKSFLATLDKKPIKLPADHVSDPRKYPNQSPYILPKQTHPFPRKTTTGPKVTKSLSVTLKPMRAGQADTVTLSDISLDTTIHEIKTQYAAKTSLPQDKIKLLLNKKPTQDLKTLKELGVPADRDDVEFSVMLMGASGTTPRTQSPAVTEKERAPEPAVSVPAAGDKMEIDEKSPAPESEKAHAEAEKTSPLGGESASAVLKTEEFWADLKGFLSQRLRDEKEGEKLSAVFRDAWSKSPS
ncbi:hypothetical protein CB0940_09316 [Lecanosticta acicola]|uniref:Ubiquitin-like domain-containing protein n=1 Tax=Lecanosticta acicola TaxID=111012 RepID=A0AAI9EE55_9PEZI|nr:hypothetical protein CB0940_09316 [Lecanosticta acicola]